MGRGKTEGKSHPASKTYRYRHFETYCPGPSTYQENYARSYSEAGKANRRRIQRAAIDKTRQQVAAPDAEGYLVIFREGFTVPSAPAARAGEHVVGRRKK
jgi:hypothetical protein